MVKLLPEKLFRKIYSLVPRLCVEVIINNKEGIILIKREIKPYKGMWHLPGSTLMYNETLEQGAKRTAKSETGLDIKIKRVLCNLEYFNSNFPQGHGFGIVYLAEPIKGKLKGNKYGRDVRFFKRIPKNIIKKHKNLIKKYYQGNRKCLTIKI